ncbi:MAG: hypothetical protein IT182_04925 [Acidobacteria bacterium]|nr:hypothetical protein [Acidobacteriota bacterium]
MIRPLVHALGLSLVTVCASPTSAVADDSAEARITVADGIVLGLSMTGVLPYDGQAMDSRIAVKDGEVYRIIVDRSGYARFAYAIRLNPRDGGVEVVLRPVRLHEAARAFAARRRTFIMPFRLDETLATLAATQTSGRLGSGDEVSLGLFDNRQTGQQVGDRLRVISLSPQGVAALETSRRQRADVRPELTLAGLTIRRGRTVLNVNRPGTFATGPVVAAGLGDDTGTVAFSAEAPTDAPPDDVATVDGHVIRFTLDGVDYECTGTEPVGPPDVTSVWMYVRREPMPHVRGFWVGAGDSVAAVLTPWQITPRRPQ